ncbi:LacI family DNA-binding transcriptional regulator [Porticoccus sp. W117]|uniref:LacI family DNA-binding transcriptional regulator n=1 Tax=Porticoccus sp. W117 TaxID=3054777 RepID=UPI002598D6C5|nr:LacI family DNA-binding transcriptional regulator [Porticoccus sp. W117]MDM3872620.1 LacI family DNA-binding transcriptional regulator [Porticoccus sp. W117]
MITLKEVAEEVGVSIATVSYALNGRGSVSKSMQNKVHEAAKRLGYRPNRKAQAMRTGMTRSIGLILPDLTNPFFPELAQKVEVAAREQGFTVTLFDTQNDKSAEEEGFQILSQHGVDGIICCPVSNELPTSVNNLMCPVVLVDRPISGFDVVQSDYRHGGELVANYVNNSGHQYVGMLSGPKNIESARQRREGVLAALAEHIEVVWEVEMPFSKDLPEEARQHLKSNRASLIIAADDLIAVGAFNEIEELGLRVPEDVSVIGFDNMPWSTLIRPHLTTIDQPIGTIGLEAVNLLAQKIKTPDRAVKTVVLSVELVERNSVLALNSA